jgi:hypothetical protein
MTDKARIIYKGAGGFLNPPGHPEHTKSVETDLQRRPENRGSMSLSFAADCDYIDASTQRRAQVILHEWTLRRYRLTSEETQDWIRQVLGYFRGCFKGGGSNPWNADQLRITQDIDPLLNADIHAGVHLIRKYYPEYVPAQDHFDGAYWGAKPERTTSG